MPYRVRNFDIVPYPSKAVHGDEICERCHRVIKVGSPRRYVLFELDKFNAVHADDWELAATEIAGRRGRSAVEIAPVGMDCARKIGLEYTRQTGDLVALSGNVMLDPAKQQEGHHDKPN